MSGRQASLGEIFEIARGGSPRPIQDYLTDATDGVNWISIADASASSKYIHYTKKRIRQEGVSKSRMVKPGDFLLTNSMSFGRPYIMKTSGCIHDGWLVLSSKANEVDQDYFFHLLGSDAMYAKFLRLAAGATVKNLNIDLVASVEVEFPAVAEQRRIAAILDKAETLRSQRRAALAQLDSLAQSIFLDMFAEALASPRRLTMSDVVQEFRYGTSEKSGSKGFPALRIPNVAGGSLDLRELKTVQVDAAEFERLRLLAGDLLFVRTNGNPDYVGRCTVFDPAVVEKTGFNPMEFIYASYLIRARLRGKLLLPVVLQKYLSEGEGRRALRARCKTSAGQYNINTEGLGNVPVPDFPLTLQQTFATRIQAIESLKAIHRAALSELDALFASLQHRAFQGQL